MSEEESRANELSRIVCIAYSITVLLHDCIESDHRSVHWRILIARKWIPLMRLVNLNSSHLEYDVKSCLPLLSRPGDELLHLDTMVRCSAW